MQRSLQRNAVQTASIISKAVCMALCVADSLISSKIGVHTHLTGIASADARVHVCGPLNVCDVLSKRECISAMQWV